ncbi:COP1-interactive protein 1-like [Phragmites australis]|uniref:COP1-interactive protein 1-like n=1 Tax=Phragmites australis TaxID=29695 RepID=UPI002D793004|nr:COP1-interactive protein 1-like [Phragmites australis]
MSRVPKWKIEKTKVKVVFRLQFHATNIPSIGWDKLFLSFISADTGKVTSKTNKANVRNGSCKWPDPIYEATRLLQDSRTKTYDDKLYKLVVAMGTSRSSILGEVDVNLAEFAEALKPASITLPLHGCDFGTLLHVTAQLLTTKTGFREFEQQRETGTRSSQQLLNQRSHDPAEVATASSDIGTYKVNARIKLKETSLGFPLVEDSGGSTENYENSSHTSDGIFTEKNDPYGGHEISSFRSTILGDLPLCSTSQSPTPEKGAHWGKGLSPQGSNDCTHGWSPEYPADKDLAAAHEENHRLRTRLEVAESAFSQLKTEATSLEHVTDKLGTETQGLAQQLAVELMSRNQLTAEVSLLRTECSNLKQELEERKSPKLPQQKSDAECKTLSKFGNDVLATDSVHDLQTEWLQGLLLLESKLQQTRNNALHGLQASDLDFLLADLGALQRVIESLKQGVQPGPMKENHYEEHLVPPSNAAHLTSPGGDHGTLKKNSGVSTGTMEEKMCELLQKLEDSKTEKENLLEKMSQMERYYESFIHKLEESQKQTAIELENLRKEHNSCFYTVSVLQAQKQKMHEEMNDQLMRFVEDRTALEARNKDLEMRAVATETTLKRVRFNYSAAVVRLQKDLELLSFQVLSMYESNETLARQSFLEDYESLPEEHSAVADLRGNKEHGQYRLDVKQIVPEGLHAETEPQAFLQENGTPDKMNGQKNLLRALKIEELCLSSECQISNADSQGNHMEGPKRASSTRESELLEMFIANIEWQIFSDVLRESHYTALDIIKCMQGRLHMLEKQLHDSNDARQSLVFKLNSALDQAKSVKESEAGYILKCDDLTVKNQLLEAKLHDITVENALLMEKLTDSERLVQEHRACESKYKACAEERNRFKNLLMKENLQTDQLKDELRSVREDFEAMKDELDKQSSLKNDMQIVSTSLQDQLGDLCSKTISLNKKVNISGLDEACLLHELQNKNYTAVMTSLEFFQQQICKEVLHLHQEKEVVEEMCDALQKRSEKAELELLDVKQKFVYDLDATKEKLNFSEELVEKLQQELQDMAHKLKISSDSQEKYAITNCDLTSKLSQMEVELQHVASENEVLVEKLKEVSATVEELERAKLSLAKREEYTRTLTQSLQSKDESLVHMESEIKRLQDDLRFTDENLLREKILKEELESALASLTSQLGEKDQVLLSFDEHKTELIHLTDQILGMENANSLMQDALSQSEQIQRDLNYKNCSLHSQLSNVENQLGTVLEAMLSSEVEASYMRSQVREAVVQLNLLRNDLEKLQLKNKDAAELLRAQMSTEAELTDQNATLQAAIHSLEIDLRSVIQEKEGLEELMKGNKEALTQVSNNKSRDIAVLINNSERVLKYQDEISQLRVLVTDLEELVDDLRSTKDEIEILNMILRSKLMEQHAEMSSLLQNHGHELTNLKEQNKDLTQKLAEQSLKTEEFKNLSIHLRELKEKAEAGRKEKEGSLFAMQDSLRIAFIKEQYESKVQELKGQVFVSKKYAEEMLLKLQSALDEVETGRKNEISLAKRIEELSMKVSEMEVEMQDLSADKRELSNAYDSIMTELECTKLNLDCCNEEKQKIEADLQGCSEERNRIRVELDLVKKLLENMALTENNISHDNSGSRARGTTSIGRILGDGKFESASKATPNTTEMDSGLQEGEIRSNDNSGSRTRGATSTGHILGEGKSESASKATPNTTEMDSGLQEGEIRSRRLVSSLSQVECINSIACKNLENCDKECESSVENHLNCNNNNKDIFKEHKKLASDLSLFQEELERLKNGNLSPLLPLDINLIDPSLSSLERTLSQLDMANEHLQSIFPSFKELPGSGNALERVLALELELAEALQAKKKTDILFQSSFLRQHNDEAAVFQSFRDINELIRNTMELKRRQVAVESELKEMQGRYSELSVQFAEVEGERQKLELNMKNRTPR